MASSAAPDAIGVRLAESFVALRVDVWQRTAKTVSVGEDGLLEGTLGASLEQMHVPLENGDWLVITFDDTIKDPELATRDQQLRRLIKKACPKTWETAEILWTNDIKKLELDGIFGLEPLNVKDWEEKVRYLARYRLWDKYKELPSSSPRPEPTMFLLRLDSKDQIVWEKNTLQPNLLVTFELFLEWLQSIAEPCTSAGISDWRTWDALNRDPDPKPHDRKPMTDEDYKEMLEIFALEDKNKVEGRDLWCYKFCHQDQLESKIVPSEWLDLDAPGHLQILDTVKKDIHTRPVLIKKQILEEARMYHNHPLRKNE